MRLGHVHQPPVCEGALPPLAVAELHRPAEDALPDVQLLAIREDLNVLEFEPLAVLDAEGEG